MYFEFWNCGISESNKYNYQVDCKKWKNAFALLQYTIDSVDLNHLIMTFLFMRLFRCTFLQEDPQAI